jgi:hypothetical protein
MINSYFSISMSVNGVDGTQAGTLYSIPSSTPIIDGYIDPTEWEDARPLTVELQGYYLGHEDEKKTIIMYSMYDDSETLYLAIKINEIEILMNDFAIIFQTNKSYQLVESIIDYHVTISDGNDVKWFNLNNASSDLVTNSDGTIYDNTVGGSQDIDVNCTYEIGNIDWEVAIPFNSTDTNGGDIAITTGDDINFLLQYESYTLYQQFNLAYPDWEYCTLHIGSPQSNPFNWLPFTITLIGLFATSLVVIIKQNKKK